MTLPQRNATLTRVVEAGSTTDYDHTGGGGLEKWAGRTGVYLTERVERAESGDSTSVVGTRDLILDAGLPVTVVQGDTVELERDDGTLLVAAVRAVAGRKLPGVAGTTRLALEHA